MSQEKSVNHYDAVIIGSGQGGTPLSKALAEAGWKTALVERTHVGGTCVNDGCTPTKTLVASAKIAQQVRRAGEYGVVAQLNKVDMERVRQRKRDVVEYSRSGSEKSLLETKNLDLIYGSAQFTGTKTLGVTKNDGSTATFTADKIFIDTGTRPAIPAIDGIHTIPFLDNVAIMDLDSVPEHLLVLGGGYIGVEFAQMYRRFGSRVTVVQSRAQLLPQEDADVAQEIAKTLRAEGIEILLDAKADQVRGAPGKIALQVQVEGVARTLEGTHLLLGTGRKPNTEDLHLQAAGVAMDEHGFIRANPQLETNVPGIYAIGDVKGGPAFTHIAYDDFRILRANLLEGGQRSTEGRMVPYTVYIDPQLGRIGMTETEAKQSGRKIRVARMPMSGVARARETSEMQGFMKVIVDADTSQILGAAILGMEGGEIAAMLQIAMMGKLPYTALHHAIFAHPTLAESLNNLFGHFDGK